MQHAKNIPIGIATHPYRLLCLLVITFTVDEGYVEDCVATAPHQHTHANPSRFRHEVKEKNRETPSAEHRRVQFRGCARTAFTPKISLHPLTPTPTPTTMRQPWAKRNCLKPDVGLEPTTLRLRVSRATDCASRACCR
jgi:hypothetical protein